MWVYTVGLVSKRLQRTYKQHVQYYNYKWTNCKHWLKAKPYFDWLIRGIHRR